MDEEFGNISSEQTSFGTEYNFSVVNLDNNQKSSSQQRKLSQKDIQSLNTSTETASETISSGSSETANVSSAPAESASASSGASGSASSSSASSSSASSASSGASGAASSAGASAGSAATVAGSTAAGVGLVTVVVGISTTLGLACSIPSDSIKTSYDKSTMFAYSFVAEFREEGELYARVKGTNFSDEKNYKLIFDEGKLIDETNKTYTTEITGEFEGEYLAGVQYAFDIYSVTAGIENNYYHELFMGELDRNNPNPISVKKYSVLINGQESEMSAVTNPESSALETYAITTSLTKDTVLSFNVNGVDLSVDLEKDDMGNPKSGNNVTKATDGSFVVLTDASEAEIILSKYESHWGVWVTGYVEPVVTKTYTVLIDGNVYTLSKIEYEGSDASETYAIETALSENQTIYFQENGVDLTVVLEQSGGEVKPNNNVVEASDSTNKFIVLTSTTAGQILLMKVDSTWMVWVDGYQTKNSYIALINGQAEEMTRITLSDQPDLEAYVWTGILTEGDDITFLENGSSLTTSLELDEQTGDIKRGNNVNMDGDMYYVINSVSMGQITLTNHGSYWGVWVEGGTESHLFYMKVNDSTMYELAETSLDPWPTGSIANYVINIDLSEGDTLSFLKDDTVMTVAKRKDDDTGGEASGNNVDFVEGVLTTKFNCSTCDIILSQYDDYWGVWVDGWHLVYDSYQVAVNYSGNITDFQRVSPTPTGLVAKFYASLSPEDAEINTTDTLVFYEALTMSPMTDLTPKTPKNNIVKRYDAQTGDPDFYPRYAITGSVDVFFEIDETETKYIYVGGYQEGVTDKYLSTTEQSSTNDRTYFSEYPEESLDTGVNNMYTATYDTRIGAGQALYFGDNGGNFNEVYTWDEVHMNSCDSGSDSPNNLAGYVSASEKSYNTTQIITRSANVQSMAGGDPETWTLTLYEYFDHYYVSCDKFLLPFDLYENELGLNSNDEVVFDFTCANFDLNNGDSLEITVGRDYQLQNDVVRDYWTGSPGAISLVNNNFEPDDSPLYIQVTLTHDQLNYVVAYFTQTY